MIGTDTDGFRRKLGVLVRSRMKMPFTSRYTSTDELTEDHPQE
jgi:hypothetical protein